MPHANESQGKSVATAPSARARLTLHDLDPITGQEESLSMLFYEEYRGYTIYSTPEGRCCIHGHARVHQTARQVRLLSRYRGGQDAHQTVPERGLHLL